MPDHHRETLRVTREGAVLRVTLSRPEVLNAIDGRMLTELRQTVGAAAADPALRVVLIGAAGERAFSAGIDVAYVVDLGGAGARAVGRELHRTFLALRTTEIPVVAAIDGLCLGAGLELALSCDFMIATDRSRFGLPNIHRGIPAIVEAALLPMTVGLQGARELGYLGEFWDARQAERRGLVHAVHPPERFEEAVADLCEKLASRSATALALQKEIIHKWMTTDLESAIDFSVNTVALAFESRDQKERMGAFLGKRSPREGGRDG